MIPMPSTFDKVKFLTGGPDFPQAAGGVAALAPFDGKVMAFLADLSEKLLKHPQARLYPDVAALGFWCRRSSITKMRDEYPDLSNRLGRGLVFHIAPSNVAVNFAYSLLAGLLSGNSNIVRLPSKDFPQVPIIRQAIEETLLAHEFLRPYICLMRYEHQKEITDSFSAICQARLIWGGDKTIQAIRTSPLPSRGLDIAFADRYSIALIQADAYLKMENRRRIAEHFFNDTLLTDQNACSSPSLIVWLGEKVNEAQEAFWREFAEFAAPKYELQAAQAVSKLSNFCILCAEVDGVRKTSGAGNLIFRAALPQLSEEVMEYRGNSGFFLEYQAGGLEEILPVCGSKCQTVGVLGISTAEVGGFFDQTRPAGVDRVVNLGHSMDFSLKWDGHDLIYSLTRVLTR